jgi:tripeptidyl-peptidase-1
MPDAASNTNEPYLEYYQFLLGKQNEEIPHVISHSYGDDEQVGLLRG